jgi:hypothetical protein
MAYRLFPIHGLVCLSPRTLEWYREAFRQLGQLPSYRRRPERIRRIRLCGDGQEDPDTVGHSAEWLDQIAESAGEELRQGFHVDAPQGAKNRVANITQPTPKHPC